jgi:hypothetical protein
LKGSTRISAEILNYFRFTVNDKLFVWNILGVTEKDFKSNKYSKEEKAKLISEKKINYTSNLTTNKPAGMLQYLCKITLAKKNLNQITNLSFSRF